jgi:hypothetical protein
LNAFLFVSLFGNSFILIQNSIPANSNTRKMNVDRMFHELSNVMGAVHNLAYMRTANLSGDVSSAEINAIMDMAHDDIMSLLHATNDFRRDFNANTRIVRQQERPRVRHVRNQRERADAVRGAMTLYEVEPVHEPPNATLAALDAIIDDEIARRRPRPPAPAPAPARAPVVMKSKAIKKDDLAVIMPDVCGICLDEYTRANSVSTCCGHNFCVSCYTSAAEHCKANVLREDRKMKCPMCRKESPKLTIYRARKTPVRRVPDVVAVAEADAVMVL